MKVSASVLLILLGAFLITCEQRNFDRCLPNSADLQCESGKFCELIPDDPNGIGRCVDAQCTVGENPSRCTPALPICTPAGQCTGCSSGAQCVALNPATPFCSAQKCGECAHASDCGKDLGRPVCDATTYACRACTLHSECDSGACVKDNTLSSLPDGKALTQGMCVPKSRVLVLDGKACATCTLQSEVNLASVDKPYILVTNYAPTTMRSPVTVPPIASLPELHIISSTADISPSKLTGSPAAVIGYQQGTVAALTVARGASVTIEGLLIANNNTAVLCDSTNAGALPALATSVNLVRTVIESSKLAIETHDLCQLTVDQTWIGRGPAAISQPRGNFAAMNLDSTGFDIVNSVFVQNYQPLTFGGVLVTDTYNRQLAGHIVNTSFYKQEPDDSTNTALAIFCSPAISQNPLTIFNSLFVNSSTFMPVTGAKTYVHPNCRAATTFGNIATDEMLPAGAGPNIVSPVTAMGLFVAADSYDLHLTATAPVSVTAGGVLGFNGVKSPSVDMDGNARGTTKISMGAFEAAH